MWRYVLRENNVFGITLSLYIHAGQAENMPCYVRNLIYDLRNDNALPTDPVEDKWPQTPVGSTNF